MTNNEVAAGPAQWRLKVGIGLIALTALAWLLIPIEAALKMPATCTYGLGSE